MNDIIVGVDSSDTARHAAEIAASLATATGANLHLITCIPQTAGRQVKAGGDSFFIDPLTDASSFLKTMSRSLPCDQITTSVVSGDPAKAICEEAERVDARIIVVGNRRVQGISRVLGAVATDVTRHAPCDVYIANTTG